VKYALIISWCLRMLVATTQLIRVRKCLFVLPILSVAGLNKHFVSRYCAIIAVTFCCGVGEVGDCKVQLDPKKGCKAMTKTKLVALVGLVGLAAWVIAFLSQPVKVLYTHGPHHPRKAYRTLEDLKKDDTSVVVAGVYSAVQETTKNSAEMLSTHFVFDAKEVLWDPQQKIKGTSIIVRRQGGVEGRTTYEFDDNPLFQVNEEAILFLSESGPGLYWVMAGPAGRFTLENDQVMTVGDYDLNFDKPMPKADFINMMRVSDFN
jgi:hypothetical protein